MAAHPLDHAVQELRAGLDECWDADDGMDDSHVMSLPVGRFVMAAYAFDPAAVCWLTYFVARRALACWELSCADERPRCIVDALGRHLRNGASVDWADAIVPTPSPYDDCLYSHTQTASDAAADAAHYIHHRNPIRAIYCISAADIAYDHVLTKDRFRLWLIEVAIPVAHAKREMTRKEQDAMRDNSTFNHETGEFRNRIVVTAKPITASLRRPNPWWKFWRD